VHSTHVVGQGEAPSVSGRLFDLGGYWHRVPRTDPRARALADRHYSRQTQGAQEFTPPGKVLVLITDDGLAVWAAVEHLDPVGNLCWRCTIFRNEGPVKSSVLVIEATRRTFEYWRRHYGAPPPIPLRTEVDPKRVRAKRDPGRCFIKAGWRVVAERQGKRKLTFLEAPAVAA
jgi:hypothetical protein